MKQLEADPWEGVELKYPAGAKFRGRVTNITDYGAFVDPWSRGSKGCALSLVLLRLSWTEKCAPREEFRLRLVRRSR